MKSEVRKAAQNEIMRLIPRAIYDMKNTYKNDKGYLALQDFFTAIPFTVILETVDANTLKEMHESDVYPKVLNYIGGYTKLVNSDNDISYLKVYITVKIPENLETEEEAIRWVRENIIQEIGNNDGIKGDSALLMVYMHEVSHIMHKHLLPSVNAKFDSIIEKHWKSNNKIPDNLKHKIKNFAEDFFINSLLLESAHSDSPLGILCSSVKRKDKKISFLYNPELSASKGHSVETIIVELLKNMEASEIGSGGQTQSQGSSGDGSGGQTQSQGSSGDGSGGQTQSQGSSGDGSGGQTQSQGSSGDGSGGQTQSQGNQPKISGTRYKLKYGDFEYEFWDMHGESNCQNGQCMSNAKAAQAIEAAARDTANQVINKMRGSGSAEIASALGFPIEVTVDWLEILESDLFKEVRHKTNRVSISWRRLKNKYRHIAHLPANVYYENVLNAIVVIDQSGSMGDIELRKINYIIKKLIKRVKTLRVIIHDDAVVYNKEFKRVVERDLEKELFKKRVACGGTSHDEPFEIIEEIYTNRASEDFIVLIFSDMYSNIEDIWGKFNWTDVASTYLVCTEKNGAGYVENLPAVKILMDTGEKL